MPFLGWIVFGWLRHLWWFKTTDQGKSDIWKLREFAGKKSTFCKASRFYSPKGWEPAEKMVSWELHLCFHSEGKHLGAIPSVRSAEGMLGAAHSGDRTINRRETHQSCPCNVETFQMRTLKKASETLIPARPVFRTKKNGPGLILLASSYPAGGIPGAGAAKGPVMSSLSSV